MRTLFNISIIFLIAFCSCSVDSTVLDDADLNSELLKDENRIAFNKIEEQINLSDYITVIDKKLTLSISLEDAIKLGFSEETYKDRLKRITKRNEIIDSLYPNIDVLKYISPNTLKKQKNKGLFVNANSTPTPYFKFYGYLNLTKWGDKTPMMEFGDTAYSTVEGAIMPTLYKNNAYPMELVLVNVLIVEKSTLTSTPFSVLYEFEYAWDYNEYSFEDAIMYVVFNIYGKGVTKFLQIECNSEITNIGTLSYRVVPMEQNIIN